MSDVAPNGKVIESVWDFPRPPRLESVEWRIRVIHDGVAVVDAPRALRVLETSQPPAYYVAPEFVDESRLMPSDHQSLCEWKGSADYAHLVAAADPTSILEYNAAWCYRSPTPEFARLKDHWAFYARKFDDCMIDDEHVLGNEGSFYGGWITENVRGPFKGGPGTLHW